jgi:hypothetical protein
MGDEPLERLKRTITSLFSDLIGWLYQETIKERAGLDEINLRRGTESRCRIPSYRDGLARDRSMTNEERKREKAVKRIETAVKKAVGKGVSKKVIEDRVGLAIVEATDKVAAKKVAANGKLAKKAPRKKTAAKKVVAKKAPAKKAVAKKVPRKKADAKKAPRKKVIAKTAPVEEPVAKKATPEEAVAHKAPRKKAVAKVAPAEEPVAKETPAEEAVAETI